jgi:hypothetical protein
VGGRERCRSAVDDPARWAAFLAAVDMQLERGDTGGFEAMFRHGYGAPPQALDVKSTLKGEDVTFVCHFSDGSVAFTESPSVPTNTLN